MSTTPITAAIAASREREKELSELTSSKEGIREKYRRGLVLIEDRAKAEPMFREALVEALAERDQLQARLTEAEILLMTANATVDDTVFPALCRKIDAFLNQPTK